MSATCHIINNVVSLWNIYSGSSFFFMHSFIYMDQIFSSYTVSLYKVHHYVMYKFQYYGLHFALPIQHQCINFKIMGDSYHLKTSNTSTFFWLMQTLSASYTHAYHVSIDSILFIIASASSNLFSYITISSDQKEILRWRVSKLVKEMKHQP